MRRTIMRGTSLGRILAFLATAALLLPMQTTLAAGASPRATTGCATTLPANILADMTLTTSPCALYTSTTDVTVAQGVTLAIAAGVTVSMLHSALNVQGNLVANGTKDSPVTFTGTATTGNPRKRWNGIVVGVHQQ